MVAGLTIVSYRGHSINDGSTYEADFIEDSGIFSTHTAEIIETERPGMFPVSVRSQPTGIDIPILIVLNNLTQGNYDQLKEWFDPSEPAGYLIVTDGSSVDRRILCAPRQLVGMHREATNLFQAILHSASGAWEADDATADDGVIAADLDEIEITNGGNTRTPVQLTITATAAKDDANSYTKMRRIFIANRSTEPLDDPVGDGYPIEVSGGAFTSPGDDVRIILNSEEQNRWVSGNSIWINLRMRPRKVATLGIGIDADDTAISVDNPEGFEADVFPDRFLAFIDNEVVDVTKTGPLTATLDRGFHSTAASHSAGATIYWIEYRYLCAIYDFDTPSDPPAPDDRKPGIDLADSTNALHVWHGPFFNDNDRRSRMWQRMRTDDGANTTHIRAYDDAGAMVMQGKSPSAGKPAFNNSVMDFPVPVAAGADTVQLDQTVDPAMVSLGYVLDQEGNESLLWGLFSDDNLLDATPGTAGSYSPGDALSRIRLNGRLGVISGDISLDDAVEWDLDVGTDDTASAHFVIEQECVINALIVGHFNGSPLDTFTGQIVSDDNGALGDTYYGPFTITLQHAGPNLVFYELEVPITLAAGAWWFGFISSTINALKHGGRTTPAMFIDETQDISPVFGLVSITAEPQSDADLETAQTIETDDAELVLDSTIAPKILAATEEDMYLLDAEIEFDEVGRSIGVFFPMPDDGEITIDTDTREAIDTETDTPIPFALTVPEWPYLAAGLNTLVWHETDPSVTVEWSFRGKYL